MLRAPLRLADNPLVTATVSLLLLAIVVLVGWLTFQFHFAPQDSNPIPPPRATARPPSKSTPAGTTATTASANPDRPVSAAIDASSTGENSSPATPEHPLHASAVDPLNRTSSGTAASSAREITPEVAQRLAPDIIPEKKRDDTAVSLTGLDHENKLAHQTTAGNSSLIADRPKTPGSVPESDPAATTAEPDVIAEGSAPAPELLTAAPGPEVSLRSMRCLSGSACPE